MSVWCATEHDAAAAEPLPENANRALLGLRRMVAAGDLGGDGRLPTERALSSRFGVGRRAVRRALDVLEAEGLVWRRRGLGTFAGQAPAEPLAAALTPEAAMEARLALEPAMAALCARRATPEEVARLRALAARVAEAPDADAAELWDGALHRLIARAAGNPLLLAAFGAVDAVRAREDWRERRRGARTPDALARSLRQHGAVVGAIAVRDEAGAREAMSEHLGRLARLLAEAP